MIQDLLPAVLQKILRPGGRFCACEQVGRSQEGILLFPLFCEKMTSLGFRQIFEEKHLLDGSDLEYLLFEFCAPWFGASSKHLTWTWWASNSKDTALRGHLEASNSENVASAFGAGAASFDVDSMPALPWKNAGKNHSRLQDNSYSRQRTHGLHLDLPEKFGSKGQLYYHVIKTWRFHDSSLKVAKYTRAKLFTLSVGTHNGNMPDFEKTLDDAEDHFG